MYWQRNVIECRFRQRYPSRLVKYRLIQYSIQYSKIQYMYLAAIFVCALYGSSNMPGTGMSGKQILQKRYAAFEVAFTSQMQLQTPSWIGINKIY